MEPGSPGTFRARSAVITAEAAMTAHEKADLLAERLRGAQQLPRFNSVLSMVCRVREDLLSQSMAGVPLPASKDQSSDYDLGSPPKCALFPANLCFSFMPTMYWN
jgi:hypothetical protein